MRTHSPSRRRRPSSAWPWRARGRCCWPTSWPDWSRSSCPGRRSPGWRGVARSARPGAGWSSAFRSPSARAAWCRCTAPSCAGACRRPRRWRSSSPPPELGLDAVLLSIPLLGIRMTVVRVVAAAVVALLIGWLVGRWVQARPLQDHGEDDEDCHDVQEGPFGDKVKASFSWGFGEVVDHTAQLDPARARRRRAYTTAPAARAGERATARRGRDSLRLARPAHVRVRQWGDAPRGRTTRFRGSSPGAALAFLLTGPATNLTTVGVLSRLHGRAAAVAFGVAMIAISNRSGVYRERVLPVGSRRRRVEHDHRDRIALAVAQLARPWRCSTLRHCCAWVRDVSSSRTCCPIPRTRMPIPTPTSTGPEVGRTPARRRDVAGSG